MAEAIGKNIGLERFDSHLRIKSITWIYWGVRFISQLAILICSIPMKQCWQITSLTGTSIPLLYWFPEGQHKTVRHGHTPLSSRHRNLASIWPELFVQPLGTVCQKHWAKSSTFDGNSLVKNPVFMPWSVSLTRTLACVGEGHYQ